MTTSQLTFCTVTTHIIAIYLIHTNFFIAVNALAYVNNRPIIGILTQQLSFNQKGFYGEKYDTYIAASYVKYLESSGARVVPIWTDQDESYYEDLMSKINGVLFPGGNTYFNNSYGYAQAGQIIYRIAVKMNERNDYFPIWGTCLGFELLIYIAAGDSNVPRSDCICKNVAMPLMFKTDFKDSRLFRKASNKIIEILRNENVTVNFHQYCVTEAGLVKADLNDVYRVISLNKDSNGLTFVSSIEHYRLPFYGTQFHPEKNNFEWSKRLSGIPHTSNAIKVSQYFGNFFVNEARKSSHVFPTPSEESENLIYNYPVTYTGINRKSSFEQCYLFKKINKSLLTNE